jgi:hypothetical protein
MSTKNLARTVIEGGRVPQNRTERRQSNQLARRAARQVSNHTLHLQVPEAAIYALRKQVDRRFSDKLGPAKRWLGSQVGRPWNKVRGELIERFDARTTAGRHILFCHLLSDVTMYGEVLARHRRRPFRVDAHGILRTCPQPRFSWYHKPALSEPEEAIVSWIGDRRIAERGAQVYWFTVTSSGKFRQANVLDELDVARWRKLPVWFRERIDPSTPPPPAPLNVP